MALRGGSVHVCVRWFGWVRNLYHAFLRGLRPLVFKNTHTCTLTRVHIYRVSCYGNSLYVGYRGCTMSNCISYSSDTQTYIYTLKKMIRLKYDPVKETHRIPPKINSYELISLT